MDKLDHVAGTVKAGTAESKNAAKTSIKALQFNNGATGLNEGVFNTFRLGKDWSERVQVGDVIDIKIEGVEEQRKAEVTGVIVGNWDEVSKLAVDNHAVRNFTPGEAGPVLKGILAPIYGDEIKSNSLWTVLYLKPVE